MNLSKNKFILVKELIHKIMRRFALKGDSSDVMAIKPKKSIEFSNLVRRILLFVFTGQWTLLLLTSERMYLKNGDLGPNWTKLLIAIVGMMSVILGFYFSGQYSDRSTEEFKKIKEYDNERLTEYQEEIKEEFKEDNTVEVTPKATLEEDEDDD